VIGVNGCQVTREVIRRRGRRGGLTLHSEAELAGLCPRVVPGQTLVEALVPQSHRLHPQDLAFLKELHVGVSVPGKHPGGTQAEGERIVLRDY
jgi:hypothetical protein